MPIRTSADIIRELVDATYPLADTRRKHALTQALHGLVRLAKSEQLLAMKKDVIRVAGVKAGLSSRRQTKAILQKIGTRGNSGQRQLEFDREDNTRAK